jgi:microcystin-dependent protein
VGRFLLARELKSPSARRARLLSELIVQTVSGPADDCPAGSVPADGRTVEIASDQAMFSLLGTDYGGDGKTTFRLPDLRLKAGLARQSGGALRLCIVTKGVYPSPR